VGPNEELAAVLGSRLVRAEKTDARICSISCRSRQPVGLGELEVRVWVLTPGNAHVSIFRNFYRRPLYEIP
jgi:hypothetical protein